MKHRGAPMLDRVDSWLMARVFWPAALWLDRWLHINNYRAAMVCVLAFGALFETNIAISLVWDGFGPGRFQVGIFGIIIAAAMPLAVVPTARRLDRCSKVTERLSGLVPKEAAIYWQGGWRLGMLIWTAIFMPAMLLRDFQHFPIWLAIIVAITDQSLLAYVAFRYFAGMPPTTGGRTRHKWSFSFDLGLVPAPSQA